MYFASETQETICLFLHSWHPPVIGMILSHKTLIIKDLHINILEINIYPFRAF